MKARDLIVFGLVVAIPFISAAPAATKKSTSKKKKKAAAPAVSPQARAKAERGVSTELAKSNNVENPGALVPFYEQLYRTTHGQSKSAVHILHFGDSHTAADEWTGGLRDQFQANFGDGGSGFSLAGRPFKGYRRFDVSGGGSSGWHTEGLARADGDGYYGLGGVSISTQSAGENVYIVTECSLLEIFYLQQPGGGALALYDNGERVGDISTNGEAGPGYFSYKPTPGGHSFELRTMQHAPVRLFGWAADRPRGVTYEALGINGAEAAVMFKWDERTLASNLEHRNPALIVLAYGTNEAGSPNWDYDSYERMFSALLGKLRQFAPTASILVVGPPDRYYRYRRGPFIPLEKVGDIIDAQREACRENGAAFWDTRTRMGGKGSMRQWVTAGLAQHDYVHFLGQGYRLLGNTLFKDVMRNYDDFVKARDSVVETATGVANQPPQ
jgi:lysophospholipase L1-like esterase